MDFRKFLFTFFILSTITAFPQDTTQEVKCRLCKNNIHRNTAPYTLDWKHEIPYIATSAGLTATAIILEVTDKTSPYTISELENLNRNDVNPFDRGATYNWSTRASDISDVFLIGAMASPVLFLTNKPTRSNFGRLALMSWEVLSINYGITYTFKNLTNRPRPFVYNPDAPAEVRTGSDGRESFYSGHVSTAAAMSFFIATVISDYHPDMKTGIKISMWAVAAVYPAVTGYFRIAAGKHYRTDIIAAYAAGAITGWLIPFLHKKKRSDGKFSFAPVNIQGNAGLYMSLKL